LLEGRASRRREGASAKPGCAEVPALRLFSSASLPLRIARALQTTSSRTRDPDTCLLQLRAVSRFEQPTARLPPLYRRSEFSVRSPESEREHARLCHAYRLMPSQVSRVEVETRLGIRFGWQPRHTRWSWFKAGPNERA